LPKPVVDRAYCFGSFEVKGSYTIKEDTIWFRNAKPGRLTKTYFMYAVFKKNKKENEKVKGDLDLVLYVDKKDTTGHTLSVTKNDFPL
jgi:hypothetical protein